MIVRTIFSEIKQQIPLEDDRLGEDHVAEEYAELLHEGQDHDPLQTDVMKTIQL